jgi:hypothetical protein
VVEAASGRIVGKPQNLRTLPRMRSGLVVPTVGPMATPSEERPSDPASTPPKVFADLWRRNERAARVAQLLRAKRKQQVEQVIRSDRQRRVHQAR